MEEARPDDTRGPCAGYTVLEFGTMVSGPMAGQNLGDLGANVIKVEPYVQENVTTDEDSYIVKLVEDSNGETLLTILVMFG